MALFQELNREGTTVVVVTHEPDIAGYAKRLIRFLDGRAFADKRQTPVDAAARLAETPAIAEPAEAAE
jgi:putative ABC transport system ATP-binding protein